MDQQQTDVPQDLDELEEGEIAEDSNDGCSITNDDNDNDCANAFDDAVNDASTNRVGQASVDGAFDGGVGGNGGGGGQKRRKKVVRKVKRKIKVKKKVVRKKGSGNAGPIANDSGNATNQISSVGGASIMNNLLPPTSQSISSSVTGLNLNQPMLPGAITTTSTTTTPLLPHLAHHQQSHETMNLLQASNNNLLNQSHTNASYQTPQSQQQQYNFSTTQLLPQNQQQQPQTQNNSQHLDSLCEQQILMLQELHKQQQQADQKHTQILRAAATDEDLRIFPPLLVRPVQPTIHQPLQPQQPLTATSTTTLPVSNTSLHQLNPTYTTTPLAPLAPVNSNFNYQQQTNNLNAPNSSIHHQTPSSPDDENGKSSYEAISKMLTLLRNSANVSDPSEIADNELLQTDNKDLSSSTLDASSAQSEQNLNAATKRGSIEYALVPILVAGIDYTKYKLLSLYEPKFKNDPRLNQQT